jgi:hypothetical protein
MDEGCDTISGAKGAGGAGRSVALLNYHWENVNFGAVLTAYALNRAVRALGYDARNIDYVPDFFWIAKEAPNPLFDDFRSKHLPMTRRIRAGEDLSFLNGQFSHFLVGSDQVWRPEFMRDETDAFLLGFAAADKCIASYAASFGTDELALAPEEREEWRLRLARFDHVTVREDSAVTLCSNLGIKARQVADPVFLLRRAEWEALADEHDPAGTASEDGVVFYTIDPSLKGAIESFVRDNADTLGTDIAHDVSWDTSVQEWLWRLSRARFVVTDSFHGSCFALIFGRPFVCVNRNTKTQTRMRSLFASFGIEGRLFSRFDEVPPTALSSGEIDRHDLSAALERTRLAAMDTLRAVLSGPCRPIEEKLAAERALRERLGTSLRAFLGSSRFPFLRYRVLSHLCPKWRGGKYRKKYAALKERRKKALRRLRRLDLASREGGK